MYPGMLAGRLVSWGVFAWKNTSQGIQHGGQRIGPEGRLRAHSVVFLMLLVHVVQFTRRKGIIRFAAGPCCGGPVGTCHRRFTMGKAAGDEMKAIQCWVGGPVLLCAIGCTAVKLEISKAAERWCVAIEIFIVLSFYGMISAEEQNGCGS